ncbi:hypothetical protein IW139_004761, partial [Coemansia sp. RSA 353]
MGDHIGAGLMSDIYGSGQDLVIHTGSGQFVQTVSDEHITDSISHVSASRCGHLVAVCGARVIVFGIANTLPSSDTQPDVASW